MNNDYLTAVNKTRKAWNKYLHTIRTHDFQNYCKVRNKCTQLTKKAKT